MLLRELRFDSRRFPDGYALPFRRKQLQRGMPHRGGHQFAPLRMTPTPGTATANDPARPQST